MKHILRLTLLGVLILIAVYFSQDNSHSLFNNLLIVAIITVSLIIVQAITSNRLSRKLDKETKSPVQ